MEANGKISLVSFSKCWFWMALEFWITEPTEITRIFELEDGKLVFDCRNYHSWSQEALAFLMAQLRCPNTKTSSASANMSI